MKHAFGFKLGIAMPETADIYMITACGSANHVGCLLILLSIPYLLVLLQVIVSHCKLPREYPTVPSCLVEVNQLQE